MHCKEWIDKLEVQPLERAEYIRLLSDYTEEDRLYAQEKARKIGDRYFGKQIFVRGLIEFTSYCKMTAITVVCVGAIPRRSATD